MIIPSIPGKKLAEHFTRKKPMTDQEMNELDRLLAEKLMGGFTEDRGGLWVKVGEFYLADWHPTRDIAQAFMVANKIDGAELYLTVWDSDDAYAHFGNRGDLGVSGVPPALAISLAARRWLSHAASLLTNT